MIFILLFSLLILLLKIHKQIFTMYSDLMLKTWLQEHTLQSQAMKNEPAFFRNLEQALDVDALAMDL